MQHRGRVALVTGAAQGIGREYARALAGEGAHVVAIDLKEDGARDTAAIINDAGGDASAVAIDISDPDSVARGIAEVTEQHGAVHILVNNAAIYEGLKMEPTLEVSIDYWRKVFSVNLDGALLMTQAVAPLMKPQQWGRIVNQSTAGAFTKTGNHYTASKLALINLTKGLARELGPSGITVNAIAPGVIFTQATRDVLSPSVIKAIIEEQSVHIEASADDLVGPLIFLCSEGARFVTGHTLIVDGGFTSHY